MDTTLHQDQAKFAIFILQHVLHVTLPACHQVYIKCHPTITRFYKMDGLVVRVFLRRFEHTDSCCIM